MIMQFFPDSFLCLDLQSRKYYFLSDDLEETDDMRQHCHDLEHQVGSFRSPGMLLDKTYGSTFAFQI